MVDEFKLRTDFTPKGDQPRAISELTEGLITGDKHQVLLGVTGSGKTFTIANVIKNVNRPAIVIAHNKALAAQLYGEFRELFPENAVEFFVSYYDYYQPEAYLPASDTYIDKDSMIMTTSTGSGTLRLCPFSNGMMSSLLLQSRAFTVSARRRIISICISSWKKACGSGATNS